MIARILAALILIPIVVAAIFHFPKPAFLLFLDVVLALTLWEFFKIVSRHGTVRFWLTFLLVLAMPWVWVYLSPWMMPFLVMAALLILTWSVLRTREMKHGFPSAAGNLLGLLYIGVPLSVAGLFQGERAWELLLVLVTIWMMDTAAYFAGRLWGKHKITPAISPGKSLEGYIAGLIAAILSVAVFSHFLLPEWGLPAAVIAGTLLGLMGTLGDLFESILKRGAGVKDSSGLIPGHGGMLDRIDSLLFALPVYYLLSVSLLAP
jgi:phosphatidate cytidylyltransferase